PALRRLNLAREEPAAERVFPFLGSLDVLGSLTHLVLPAVRTAHDAAVVQAALDRMPRLRELVIARAYACFGEPARGLHHAAARIRLPEAWSWPPRDQLRGQLLEVDGYTFDPDALIEVLEEQYDELPEAVRAIWYRFWTTPDTQERAFAAHDLLRALDVLTLELDLERLRDHLHDQLAARPRGYYATVRWVMP
ncbi:MAG: hypothetical protein M3680_31950, partial [Myxococcota bacterium]|nr:hypothetical protein [Myxococcota bacterium]